MTALEDRRPVAAVTTANDTPSVIGLDLANLLDENPDLELASIRFIPNDDGTVGIAGRVGELVGVECPQCHQAAGRPHTEYCTLDPGRVHAILGLPVVIDPSLPPDTIRIAHLRTPAEWAILEDCLILDPDGWRSPQAEDFDEPITQAEYESRRNLSTVRFGGNWYTKTPFHHQALAHDPEHTCNDRCGWPSQTSQPATRTSQPDTQVRIIEARPNHPAIHAPHPYEHMDFDTHPATACEPSFCGRTPLATPTPHLDAIRQWAKDHPGERITPPLA